MTSGRHRMPANPHIVGGIEESHIHMRSVADDPLQKSGITAVAASNPMLAEYPDVAWLRSRRCREGRNDLIIGIGSRRENDVDLTGREAGQSRIDIDIDRSELAQFELQDFQIPAGIERDLVVGDSKRPLLGLREAGQGDSWDLSKPHDPGGLKPAMSRDDVALRISKDRIGEAERVDGRPDLLDLTLGMCTGIARIGNEVSDRAVCNGQPRWEASRCWFVHEPETK
jgi:hypothetical protein